VATYRVTNEEEQQTFSLALPQDTSPVWLSLINVGSWNLKVIKYQWLLLQTIVDYCRLFQGYSIHKTGLCYLSNLTNIMHKIFFYNKFIIRHYMFRALCAHHQEVKIVLYSIWYHHTCRWPSRAQSSLILCTGRPPTGVMITDAV